MLSTLRYLSRGLAQTSKFLLPKLKSVVPMISARPFYTFSKKSKSKGKGNASQIIGIDLGTTNSCVAIMEGGTPVVISNAEGQRTTPSYVAFDLEGQQLVGDPAKNQALTNPENTFYATKRLIGRKFKDDEVQKDLKSFPFKIVASTNGDAWVYSKQMDKQYSPSQIGALTLMKMKETAEAYLDKKVTEAVITVPAYFNDSQRQATKDAGRIAGLDVKRIINEPTAASLAYGIKEDQKEAIIAVFDLGGGTFDISILEIDEDGVFEVRATNGDTSCGGEDIDGIIQDHVTSTFKKQTGVDISDDTAAIQRVRQAAEKAKRELSSSQQAQINLPYLSFAPGGTAHNLMMTLTRGQLEKLTRNFLKKTLEPCKQCLKDAKVSKDQITDLLLVGGQTRMPLVQKMVRDFFGVKPNKTLNPDEAIAVGASIQGSILKGEFTDLIMLDVTPLSLGIGVSGGLFSKLIEKNTTIPAQKSDIYTTTVDNQAGVNIDIFQGERPLVKDNHLLGEFKLIGIPRAKRGIPQIQVEFDIDANGLLKVTASDLATGKEKKIQIKSSGGLSEAEIQQMEAEAEKMKAEDKKKKKVVVLRNKSESLIFATDDLIAENKQKLKKKQVEDIEKKSAKLQDLLEKGDDPKKIQEAYEKLDKAGQEIVEDLYTQGGGRQQQQEQQQDQQDQNESKGKKEKKDESQDDSQA